MYVVIQRFIIFICKICICIFTQTYPIYSFLTDLDFKPLNSFLKYIHDISIYIYTHKNTHVCCHIKIYYIYMQNMYLYIHLDLSHLLFPDRPRLQTLKYFPQIYSRCLYVYVFIYIQKHTHIYTHACCHINICYIYIQIKLIILEILSQIDKLSSFQIQKVLLDQLRFCRLLIAQKKQTNNLLNRRKKQDKTKQDKTKTIPLKSIFSQQGRFQGMVKCNFEFEFEYSQQQRNTKLFTINFLIINYFITSPQQATNYIIQATHTFYQLHPIFQYVLFETIITILAIRYLVLTSTIFNNNTFNTIANNSNDKYDIQDSNLIYFFYFILPSQEFKKGKKRELRF
eukprot:TRINITY_DN8668_c0_g1_i3.p1 TRINITY_DN8668_c0_g1~~TRINITY_DN8668_c0_g1_i3.p1  ORF type:complete len:341 (-),score=-35.31 TRINITY_DN8668_c0_g1_i3:648-1670(-)